MSDDADEGYNEFIKKYESRYEWEMLIQAKKESVTGIITGFKDYISQSGIANLNGVQYLLRELLASDDNTNYASYLLNFSLALFFPARYKACRDNRKGALGVHYVKGTGSKSSDLPTS
ncbi:hypothetical protein C1646_675989 [Rhizophagus diaphanus]|nr:hypothetical protein C1646_675989 [Rhizophagus diaphanus] [Rhizophagus sp. MUCL 43196]